MEALQNGKYFLSCDWGTSNFRLQLVDINKLVPLDSVNSDEGISGVYSLWRQSGIDRFDFYNSVLQKHITAIESRSGISLKDIPLVISGMASATIGMKELPYKIMPFSVDGSDIEYDIIDKTIIISGARTNDDVMRGEETQVIGLNVGLSGEQYVILPGTHSKHVTISDGKAIGLQTYMTGEVFQLLSNKSILAGSINQVNNFAELKEFFAAGLKRSISNNFLNSIFSVRTNILLNKVSPEQNYYYMSGLVIGEELKNVTTGHVFIIGSTIMNELYAYALSVLNKDVKVDTISAEEAIFRGQHKILGLAGLLLKN